MKGIKSLSKKLLVYLLALMMLLSLAPMAVLADETPEQLQGGWLKKQLFQTMLQLWKLTQKMICRSLQMNR